MDVVKELQAELCRFAKERDWDQFHTPKNLAMALSGEAGELLELFQWLTPEQSQRDALSEKMLLEIEGEMADVLLYLLRLADKLGIDVIQAARSKIELNAQKYPVDKAKGNVVKYSRRDD